jgi:hypothetical protein
VAIDQAGESDEIAAGHHQHAYRRSEFLERELRAPQQSVDFVQIDTPLVVALTVYA